MLTFLLLACDAAPAPSGTGTATSDPDSVAAADAIESGPARTRGLDSTLVAAARARAAALPRLYSMLIARDGELLVEEYYNGRGPNSQANIKSASKSVISALVGIAISEGHLEGIDQPMASFFEDYISASTDRRVHEVTLEHLLSMQTGMEPTSFDNYGAWVSSSNWVRHVLTRPFTGEPGGRMLYSTGSTHLLSAILTRATGMSTLAYARSRLAEPLGFTLPAWTADPQGIYFGGNEMSMRPRDMLAFGELYRNGGVHDGQRIVPESWIEESWRQRTSSPFNGHGYGLGWWMRPAGEHDVYFAWGYGGQYIFIVPELALTFVTTSDAISPREGDHNRSLHRILDELLIPAAVTGDPRAAAPST